MHQGNKIEEYMKKANGKMETSTETNLKHERDTNTTNYAFLRSLKILPRSVLGRKVIIFNP